VPCYKTQSHGGAVSSSPSYKTEAQCLQACKEGACCEDGPVGSPPTCSVKPQCQCQVAGQVFKGVGTVCDPNPCCTKCNRSSITWCQSPACIPKFLDFTYSLSFPIQFVNMFGGYYIRPFSASGSCTLRGVMSSEPSRPCGDYSFFAGPPEGAAFNAYEFNCGVSGGGPYFIRHTCRLVQDGRYDGPQGDRYIYRATTDSTTGQLSWSFSTYGIIQFVPASSGYCYQSGVLVSSEVPLATVTASVTNAYGVM